MEATLLSSYTQRKQAHVPRPSTSIQSYSSMSSSAPSDNDDDTYYSDVESDAASVASVTSSLGDFVFDSEEEYADYYEVVRATIKGSSRKVSSSQTSSPSAPHQQQQQPRQKTKKSYRKSTSSFFFASSSLPQFSASFASQNPGLQAAASNLSAKMAKLKSYSRTIPRELQVQDEYDDVSSSPSSASSSGSSSSSLDTDSDAEPASPVYCEGCNIDERFERAMLFAQWNKRGRSGEWEAPLGVNPGLLELVAMTQ